MRPEAYPHSAEHLALHETHISWVVLAGPYAYKVKKPVRFRFLDFSTLERRRADCEAEVRLNRRLSPEMYLGVVDLVERGGETFVGGPGRVLEPAVQMRRLPQDGMLSSLLERGAAGPELLRRIARRLASFHASAATGPGVDEHGQPEAVARNWRETFAEMAPFIGRTLPSPIQAAIATFVERFLVDQRGLLERRVREHRVRDGHGDLHASSICLDEGRLWIFDCIEFNDRFRCIDVAAEVAFLAMDLEHHGRADLASSFLSAYVRASGDAELPRLLDFYISYRAYVRGTVLSLRLDQPGLSQPEAERVSAEARSYFDLAWAHAGGPPLR